MGGTDPALPGASADSASAWEAVRADADIQFGPVDLPEPSQEPGWFAEFVAWFVRMLRPVAEAIGVSWPVLQWILLGILALGLAWFIWRLVAPIARIRLQRGGANAGEEDTQWTPGRGEALALLEDADALAAEGRYDEATHLLLRRSVGQIEQARPGTLDPSNTAREIASLAILPQGARAAFAVIAERVERSLFALKRLEAADWQAARAAYADFALADLREGQIS